MPIRVNHAVIPDEAIAFEYDRLVRFYARYMPPEEIKTQAAALRRRAIDQVIGLRLLMDQVQTMDIRVPHEDIEQRLRRMEADAGGPDRLHALLEERGQDTELLRRQIEQGRKVDLLIERITAALPEPTEDEMRAHFRDHASEFAIPERAQAQHILVTSASDRPEDMAAATARIEAIREEIDDGADFSDLAAAHSACPSGKNGGSLGWFARGMMIPAFDEAVFAMDVGDVSDVVASSAGLHIIRKLGEETGRSATYAEARDKVREFLRHARRGEAVAAHVAELRTRAQIEFLDGKPGTA